MFDSFAGTIGLVVIALMEMISVVYIYGHERYKFFKTKKILMRIKLIVHRFTEDIFQMTGYRPGRYWQYTWRYIGPVIMVCILVSSVVCMVIQNPTYSAWNAAEVRIYTYLDSVGDLSFQSIYLYRPKLRPPAIQIGHLPLRSQ